MAELILSLSIRFEHFFNLNHKLTIGCASVLRDELSFRIIIELNAREMELRRLMESFSVCNIHLITGSSKKKSLCERCVTCTVQWKIRSVRNLVEDS